MVRCRLRFRSRALSAFAVLTSCALLASACDTRPLNEAPGRARVQFPDPRVKKDLPEIEQEGTLRVLLRNTSSSYYLLRGQEHGFEYELARQVAEELGLRLEVVLPDSQISPLGMLNLGDVDLVALPLQPLDWPDVRVRFTEPYHSVRQVLVVHERYQDSVRTREDLAGRMVAVRHFSSAEAVLFDLRREGIDVGIVMHPFDTSTEIILDRVADGTYPAAVAHDSAVEAQLRFRNELVEAFPLSEEKSVHWAVRSNSPRLREAVDAILRSHYRVRPDAEPARSEFYNVVHERYFGGGARVRRHEEHPFRLSRTGRLSPYDDLFRAAAFDEGLDWRLLASVAFQESRFDPGAVSWAGAVGLMQVKSETAGVSEDSLKIPEISVRVGARLLAELFEIYSVVPESDRLAFVLAAYNCGQGHLDDARMLSIERRRDPNQWEDSVRESLLLLAEPQYHRRARYGYVRGSQTTAYVTEVLRRYDLLRRLTEPRGGASTVSLTFPSAPPAGPTTN